MTAGTDPLRELWTLWAPPLDPPEEGGLPYDAAEAIVEAWWDLDPHEAAALMWEAYAAMLPPEQPVRSVQTGVQSVTYAGPYAGAALARAAWHRSLAGNLVSVPLRQARPCMADHRVPVDWWQKDLEHPW